MTERQISCQQLTMVSFRLSPADICPKGYTNKTHRLSKIQLLMTFLSITKIQQFFLKMLRSMIFSIFIKFCWILVINKKVISKCIFERWCVLLVTRPKGVHQILSKSVSVAYFLRNLSWRGLAMWGLELRAFKLIQTLMEILTEL